MKVPAKLVVAFTPGREMKEAGWPVEGRARRRSVHLVQPQRFQADQRPGLPADELAIPDDDDAPGGGPLGREFATAGYLAGGFGSADDDESAADFGMESWRSLFG